MSVYLNLNLSVVYLLSVSLCLSVCLSVYIFSLFMSALLTGFVCLAICLSVSIYPPFYGAERPVQITLFFRASICLSIYFRVCLRLKKESDVLIQPRLFIKQLAECLPIMYANDFFYQRPERLYDRSIFSLHLILSEHPPSHSPPLRSIVRHTCMQHDGSASPSILRVLISPFFCLSSPPRTFCSLSNILI